MKLVFFLVCLIFSKYSISALSDEDTYKELRSHNYTLKLKNDYCFKKVSLACDDLISDIFVNVNQLDESKVKVITTFLDKYCPEGEKCSYIPARIKVYKDKIVSWEEDKKVKQSKIETWALNKNYETPVSKKNVKELQSDVEKLNTEIKDLRAKYAQIYKSFCSKTGTDCPSLSID